MAGQTRKQLFVDPHVQGNLALRVVGYWLALVVTAIVMLITWRMFTGPARVFYTHFDDLWFQYKLPFIASVLLLPIIVYDMVRFSNRFSGPLLRFRRGLRQLASGEPTQQMQFRAGDFWSELAEDYNLVAARLELLERQIATLKGETTVTDEAEPASTNVKSTAIA
ncbi:MAG: hypothetical protein SFX18_09530 [Pirellulales bacterium]|nr:hypothetical protein [Pirellulales bacterium]